jgi:phage shock protein A
VQGAISSINIMDPTSEIARYEEQVRREEARVAGHAELQGATLESQFAELEDYGRNTEVEARLAALKSGGTSAAPQLNAANATDEGSAVPAPEEDRTTY